MLKWIALLLAMAGVAAGQKKHVVFVGGDQEYRSEESLPALARILSERHGFHCTLILPANPNEIHDLPGLEALRTADLMVLFARWLELPDSQMKEIVDYANSGRPIVGLRTATHPFRYVIHKDSPYAKYSYDSKEFPGGFGRQILGETWIAHWGEHQRQSTRGVIVAGMESHPVLRGVHDIWGESDVYKITTLSGDSRPLVMGQVLAGMEPSSPPVPEKAMMPVAWIKGNAARVFTTTMGHPMDFQNEGVRRMFVNACYWAMGLEGKIAATSNVDFVGPYHPHPIGMK